MHDAVIVFNEGEVGRLSVFEKLGLSVGVHARAAFQTLDSGWRVRRGRPAWHRKPEGSTGPWLLLDKALLVKHTKLGHSSSNSLVVVLY